MIQSVIIGNIGKNKAKRENINGDDLLIFDICINQKEKDQIKAIWFNCLMPYNNKAEKMLTPGAFVCVTGSQKVSAYTNSKGEAIPSLKLFVNSYRVLSKI